jgi:hypothetical protein
VSAGSRFQSSAIVIGAVSTFETGHPDFALFMVA